VSSSAHVVIFRTHSDVEASVVRGLLEAHGVPCVVASGAMRNIFPLTIDSLGDVRLSVHEEDAEEARRIIDSHRTELTTGRSRLRDEFDVLARAGTAQRPRLPSAMTHTSRARTSAAAWRQRVARVSAMPCSAAIADVLFRDFRSGTGARNRR
jgi:hypothetical protein